MKQYSLPFIRIKKQDNVLFQEGEASCSFGHKIEYGKTVDGVYAEWEWDGKVLSVSNDRYGLYPLFIYQSLDEILLAPTIEMMVELGAPTDFDDDAMAVFLRFGVFIGDDTPFKHIRSLPPGLNCQLAVGDPFPRGVMSLGRGEVLGRKQVIEGFIELFRQAIRRRIPADEFVLPLSGGQDSRHILLELARQNIFPKFCCTAKFFPPSTSEDVPVAANLCRLVKVRHIVVDQPASRFRAEILKNKLTNYCTQSMHGWFLPVANLINSSNVVAVFDGIGGDVLSAGLFSYERLVTLYQKGMYDKLVHELFADEIFHQHYLDESFTCRWSRGRAIVHLKNELERYENTNNPVSNFYFWNRTRKFAYQATAGMVNRDIIGFAPFLDHELFDFLLSQPCQMYLDKNLHRDVIEAAFPQYANIGYARKKHKQWVSPIYFQRFAFETLVSMSGKGNYIINKSYATKRLIRCLVDYKYMKNVDWLCTTLIYLNQLGKLGCNSILSQHVAFKFYL